MKTKNVFLHALLLASAVMAVPAAQAAVIVADSFSGANGASLVGASPDTGSGTWFSANNRPTSYESGRVRIDSTESLDYDIGGQYAADSVLTVSAELDRNNLNTGAWAQIRGIGLGFRATDSFSGEGWSQFRGIVLTADGRLTLIDTGSGLPPDPNLTLASGVASSGVLEYSVNTLTGDIFDISYAGNLIADVTTSNFTTANISVLSSYSVGITGSVWGYVDDISLTGTLAGAEAQVPVPGTVLLLGAGLVGLVRRFRG